jgi:hypothetical protein
VSTNLYMEPGSGPVNLPAVRALDAHSLAHRRKRTQAAAACDAADLVDGLTRLQSPTIKVAAVACGVSTSYVVAALRLSPMQRDEVRQGKRTLAPSKWKMLPAPVTAETRIAEVVSEFGMIATTTGLERLRKALNGSAAAF